MSIQSRLLCRDPTITAFSSGMNRKRPLVVGYPFGESASADVLLPVLRDA